MYMSNIAEKLEKGKGGIYILSRPVHSGKTTLLMDWIVSEKNVGGILCPDINGLRKLYDISSKKYYDFQVPEGNDVAGATKICNYVFDEKIFEFGRQLLLAAIEKPFDYVIVDEVGKLELYKNAGLEPAVSKIIKHYQSLEVKGKLLLIIRDYLLEESIKQYQLEDAILI